VNNTLRYQIATELTDLATSYHIGESLTAAMRTYLRFIGLEDEFVKHGFNVKQGALFQLVQGMEANWTDFQARIPDYETWNVVRSEMDNLMFRHAEKEGCVAFDETKIDSIEFENNGDPKTSRPIAAKWTNKDGKSGKISFEWLVDASGRAGVMSTQYLKNRVFRESFRNIAVWSYWKGIRATGRPYSFYAEVLTDKKGWAWFIPLNDGTTSVGFVTHLNTHTERRGHWASSDGKKLSIKEHYDNMFQYAPHIKDFIKEGEMIPGTTHSSSDYSYWASGYAGDHYRLVGDAANFVDPFFSTGIHVGMSGGLAAATTICASIRGDVDEQTAIKWHDLKVGMLHVRSVALAQGTKILYSSCIDSCLLSWEPTAGWTSSSRTLTMPPSCSARVRSTSTTPSSSTAMLSDNSEKTKVTSPTTGLSRMSTT
jgi:flavine halogenase